MCIAWDGGDVVSELFETPSRFTGGTIQVVAVDTGEDVYEDLELEGKTAAFFWSRFCRADSTTRQHQRRFVVVLSIRRKLMNIRKLLTGALPPLCGALVFAAGQNVAQAQTGGQVSPAATPMLEEVVVTARRREENLQDLPLSVTVINSDALSAQSIYDVMDISDFVPNVNFTNTDRRGIMAVFIRGIGNDSPGSLQPVGAGVYLDGHYLPNTVGNMMNTVDIDRIEVLRGPQGTLFGKNTTGGAIQIITNKPQDEFAADVRVRAGDYGTESIRAMLNIPWSSGALRFSLAEESSDGYFFNRTLNRDYGATDVEAFGAAVRFTPNDNWLIDLAFRGNYQDDDNAGGQCRAYPTQSQVDNLANLNPGDPAEGELPGQAPAVLANHPAQIYTGPTFADGVSQWGGATTYPDGTRANIGGHVERLYAGATIDTWNGCNLDNALGPYVVSSEKLGFLELDNENVNLSFQWDSNGAVGGLDNMTVKFVLSSHETAWNYLADRDYTQLDVDAIGTPPLDGRGQVRTTEQAELLFTMDFSDSVNLVFGGNFFDDESETGAGGCLNIFLANLPAMLDPNSGVQIPCQADGGTQFDRLADREVPGGPGVAGMSGRITSESVAVFGHVAWDVNDNWTLDFGARWTDEDRGFHQVEVDGVPGTCTFTQPGDPSPTSLCEVDYILSYQSVIADGFFNDTTANFSEVTPMFSATYHLPGGGALDSGNVYFLISEGFLSGSFNDELNTTLVPELAPLLTYEPENVTNYEVGFKGTLLDGRLGLAADIFFMEYENKQEQIDIDNADGAFGGDPQIGIVTNAATVDIYGLEFELRSQPWDGGFISAELSWLKSEYGEFNSFDPTAPGGTIDRANLSIEDYSPDWTLNASLSHAFALGNGATLSPMVGVYWQDDYDWITGIDRNSPASFCNQPSYAKFRARLTYEADGGDWNAALYGRNIGDERYFETCDDARSGVFDYRYGAPEEWGLEFVYNWGNT